LTHCAILVVLITWFALLLIPLLPPWFAAPFICCLCCCSYCCLFFSYIPQLLRSLLLLLKCVSTGGFTLFLTFHAYIVYSYLSLGFLHLLCLPFSAFCGASLWLKQEEEAEKAAEAEKKKRH